MGITQGDYQVYERLRPVVVRESVHRLTKAAAAMKGQSLQEFVEAALVQPIGEAFSRTSDVLTDDGPPVASQGEGQL
jgi:hypothetical protein